MDSRSLEIHPEARLEVLEAINWYEQRRDLLGEEFEQEFRRCLRVIEDAPLRWAIYLHGTRRFIMDRFPYLVVYRVQASKIQIVAVAHGSRKPGYWKKRKFSD